MFAKTVFAALIKQYLTSNPQVVERLAAAVLHGLIEHIAPSTAAGLGDVVGPAPVLSEAVASPLAGSASQTLSDSQVLKR
jgi:hypothetical protein